MNNQCSCSAPGTQSLYFTDFTNGYFANGGIDHRTGKNLDLNNKWYCQQHAIQIASQGARPLSFEADDTPTLEIFLTWLNYQFKNRRFDSIYAKNQIICSQCDNPSVRQLATKQETYQPYCLLHALEMVRLGAPNYKGATGSAPHFGLRFILDSPRTPKIYKCDTCSNMIETIKNQTGFCDACRKEIDDHWHESKMIDSLLYHWKKILPQNIIF